MPPAEKMRGLVSEVRGKVESSFGPADAIHKTIAGGLFTTGRLRELRTGILSDTMNPRTRVYHYNQ